MSNKEKKADVQIPATIDQRINQLFETVRLQKEAISKCDKPSWNTNCLFGYTPTSLHDKFDIRVITDTRKLVEVLAFLIGRSNESQIAADQLGVDYKFTWLGFSLEEWTEDLKMRTNQINIQSQRINLKMLEDKLNNLVSPEQRREMELAAIEKILG